MNEKDGHVYSLACISEANTAGCTDALDQHFGTLKKQCTDLGLKALLVHRASKVLHFFEGTHEQIQGVTSLIETNFKEGLIATQNYAPSPSILGSRDFQIMNANRQGFDGESILERFLDTTDPDMLLGTQATRLRRLFFRLKSEESFNESGRDPMSMN